MREILFRAKRIDNGEWVEGSLIDSGNHYQVFIYPHDDGASTMSCRTLVYHGMVAVDSNTICQFTGLLDKNGRKIWENDIFKHYCKVSVGEPEYYEVRSVAWDEIRCRFINCDITTNECFFMKESCVYEVIGTIFDNPELLKGGE